ncbi:hypothetical protein [Actinokineospora sp. NPDC004072]
MRKTITAAALGVAAVFCTALPAAADDSTYHALVYLDSNEEGGYDGWDEFGYFHGEDDCYAVGELGQDQGWWRNYFCQEYSNQD